MSAHTLGPWKYLPSDSLKLQFDTFGIYGANHSVVAQGIINQDDAKLMAAAPELLAACKEMVAYTDTSVSRERGISIYKMMVAAIAKAEK